MSRRAHFLVVAFIGMLLAGLGLSASPAAANGVIHLDKSAPASVLLGENIPYTLKATNTAAFPEYNIGFSDILPLGMTYEPGSVSPDIGAPTITTRLDGRKVLVWTNIADLQVGSDFQISFEAKWESTPTDITPTDTNDSYVVGQEDPRTVPGFDGDGLPVDEPGLVQSFDSATTVRAPFVIEKIESSPESELLRGVHDQRTVYTLRVRNNTVVQTSGVSVSDYLPAGLEFLGCGDEDNSQVVTEEYPGSGPLGDPPYSPAPSPCPTPDTVTTLTDPAPAGIGSLTGVYTEIAWAVGDLAPGDVTEIKYVAGIPLQANEDSWPGPTPTPGSLEQGSNLDNNSGASTRELDSEASLTNYASAIGFFEGTPTEEYVESTSETVTVEDIRLRKSASKDVFTPGGIVTFSLKVDVSEYMDGSDIVVTDVLPDGYCPLGPASYLAEPDCAPTGDLPSVDYASVTHNPDGTFTIVFEPIAVSSNDTQTITFPARMRGVYTGDGLAGRPTVAGDSFTDNATLAGTTTPIPPVTVESGPQAVTDASSATQHSNLPTVGKTMKPRYFPMDCDDLGDHPYGRYDDFSDAQRTFRKGDRICFKLRVDFPDISTKDAVVTDFLPVGTEYIPGTANLTVNNTAPVAASVLTPVSGPLSWTLGDDVGGNYFVPQDAVFEIVFAVRVLQPAAPPLPDLTGNLMKMSTTNTGGQSESYRDMANYDLAPAANVGIRKGVIKTTFPAATFNPPADHKPVGQGSTATFQVDVHNYGRPDFPGAEFSVRGVETWDVLPAGITCADISDYRYIKPGTTTTVTLDPSIYDCYDPHASGFPEFTGQDTLAAIVWSMPTPDLANDYSIFTGQELSFIYDMKIPDQVSVSQQYTNTSYVRSFESFTDETNVTATYFPQDNVDLSVPVEDQDASPATDPSDVYVPNVGVGKSAETSVDEANNNLTTQATIGETITYTYSATVPANSTVFDGELYDVLPAGFDLVSLDDWGLGTLGTHPPGFTFDQNIGTNPTGRLDFPGTYANDTDTAQVFLVQATVKVGPDAAPCATDPCEVPPAPATNVAKVNTAKFASTKSPQGLPWPIRIKNYTINVVQPAPSVTKSADPSELVNASDPIVYTIKVTTPSGRPPAHNGEVVDCLPVGMQWDQWVPPLPLGTLVMQAGACPGGATKLTYRDFDLQPGQVTTLKYQAHFTVPVDAGKDYPNTAVFTSTSMPGADPVEGERTYTTSDTASVRVPTATSAKNVMPDTATVGEKFSSYVQVKLGADVLYGQAGLIDNLPSGVDPASVSYGDATCVYDDDSPCPAGWSVAPLLPPSGQIIGWAIADLDSDPLDRYLRIPYDAVVTDEGENVAGRVLANTAQFYYGGKVPPATVQEIPQLPYYIEPVTDSLTVTEPDVGIYKTVDGLKQEDVTPGQEFTYALLVDNAFGDDVSTAYNITVVDTLPDGVEVVGSPSDGGIVSGNTITWTLSSLDVGGSKELTYTARLKPPVSGEQTNTASVNSYFSLPDGGREYVGPSDTAAVNPLLPSLEIEKFATDPLAYIGQPYQWEMEVFNDAETATAYDVSVQDTMPVNWVYVPGSSVLNGTPIADPVISGQDLTWSGLGDLAAGDYLVLTYESEPTPAVVSDPGVGLDPPIPHDNTAVAGWVDGPTEQPWPTHTTEPSTATTYIASADLAIDKNYWTQYQPPPDLQPNEVVPGTDFDWTIEVANNGTDTSVGPFVVTDTLPAGTSYVGYSGTGWTCSATGQDVTCTLGAPGTLDAGDSLPTLTLTVHAADDIPLDTQLENTATVTGTTYDPEPQNNTDTNTVTAHPVADLAMVKTSTVPFVVGSTVTYTLAVTNYGPSVSALPVQVTDQLPSGLSIVSIDGHGQWDCTPASGEAAEITCDALAALPPNLQAPLIDVTVEVLDSPGSTATNTATVTPTTTDPDLENNTDTVTDPVDDTTQLAIEKATTGANPVVAGRSTQFTVTVGNLGPAKAKNVVVTDTLEAGLTATSASGLGWDCTAGGSTVTCSRANFKVSDSPSKIVVTADVDKSVPVGTRLKNVATVTTSSPQPGGNPPPATSTVDVVNESDLAIVKSHPQKTYTLGDRLTWTLAVSNDGPSDNPGPVTVTDTLPKGTEFASATGQGWTCSATGQTVTCQRAGVFPVAATGRIDVTVLLVSGSPPGVTNTATVESPTPDPNLANNTATDQVPVKRAEQTAPPLPKNPRKVKGGRTDEGQKLRTRVVCRPVKSSAAGEVSYCKVKRFKNGTVKITVKGTRPMRVTVIQTAPGTKNYRPFRRSKTYTVRP